MDGQRLQPQSQLSLNSPTKSLNEQVESDCDTTNLNE